MVWVVSNGKVLIGNLMKILQLFEKMVMCVGIYLDKTITRQTI